MKALSNLIPELVNFGISVCSFSWLMSVSMVFLLGSSHNKLCCISRRYMPQSYLKITIPTNYISKFGNFP